MGTEETDGGCGAASDTQAEQDHKPDDAEPAAKAQRTGTSTLPALAHGGGFGSLASQSSSAFATQPSNDADAALGTSMPHVPQLFHGTSNGEAADNNDGHDDSKNAESSQQDGNALTGEKTTESENAANTVAMPGEAESTGEVNSYCFHSRIMHLLLQICFYTCRMIAPFLLSVCVYTMNRRMKNHC